jgi:hypothetical protein
LANCHQIERRTGLVMNKRLERGKIELLIVFPLGGIFFNGGLNLSTEMSQNDRTNAAKIPINTGASARCDALPSCWSTISTKMLLGGAGKSGRKRLFDVKSPKKFTRQTGVFAAWV